MNPTEPIGGASKPSEGGEMVELKTIYNKNGDPMSIKANGIEMLPVSWRYSVAGGVDAHAKHQEYKLRFHELALEMQKFMDDRNETVSSTTIGHLALRIQEAENSNSPTEKK